MPTNTPGHPDPRIGRIEELLRDSFQGEPASRRKPLPFLENARFALTRYLRVIRRRGQPDRRPDFSGSGWAAFRDAVKVRNRLTHPKNLKEGRVSDADLRVVRRAVEWWEGTQKELIGRLRGVPIAADNQEAATRRR